MRPTTSQEPAPTPDHMRRRVRSRLLIAGFAACLAILTSCGDSPAHNHANGERAPEPTSGETRAPSASPSRAPARPSLRATPAPTVSPTTRTAPRLRLGISYGDRLVGMAPGELRATLDDARALGVGWIRLDLAWPDIQPNSAGEFDWSAFDKTVAEARSRDLQLLAILAYTPAWARPADCTTEKCVPADPHAFASFAAAAARRYAGKGVHTWEIWNEPNISRFWQPAPDPVAYTRLLGLTAHAIRQADPSAFVISGGLAPAAASQGVPQLEFLDQICALGANRLVDAIGYHPYSYPALASSPVSWSAWSQIAGTSTSFATILARHGTPAAKIWATEYGAPTSGLAVGTPIPSSPGSPEIDHVDDQRQALMAGDAVRTADRTQMIAAFFWFTDRDAGTSTDSAESFFGLRRADGSPKPAYYSFRDAVAAIRQ